MRTASPDEYRLATFPRGGARPTFLALVAFLNRLLGNYLPDQTIHHSTAITFQQQRNESPCERHNWTNIRIIICFAIIIRYYFAMFRNCIIEIGIITLINTDLLQHHSPKGNNSCHFTYSKAFLHELIYITSRSHYFIRHQPCNHEPFRSSFLRMLS